MSPALWFCAGLGAGFALPLALIAMLIVTSKVRTEERDR